MIFDIMLKHFGSNQPLLGPSKRREEGYLRHFVRCNRSFARSFRLFSPTVGYLDVSWCSEILYKNVYFLLMDPFGPIRGRIQGSDQVNRVR